MKKDKITLQRAINCYTPCRITIKDNIERFNEAQTFEDFYGFRFEECWNLDVEAAYWILVRLVHFRDCNCGTPNSFLISGETSQFYSAPQEVRNIILNRCHKRWKTCLEKIIRGLFMYITIDFPNDKEKKIIRKGFKLLFDNWESLWD